MGPFDMLQISGSALGAERRRSEVIAANMANADTTHTPAGGPFQRKEVVFSAENASPFALQFADFHRLPDQAAPGSVRISEVVSDPAPSIMRYDPSNPDANKQGFVAYPNINPVQEMVDLMDSVRAYQLNASAVSASKQMIEQSIDILKS
jgi:flagellar basal-body rod protein FlgC